MSRLFIVSNRLPINITINNKKNIKTIPSVGGLATGLKSIYQQSGGKWIGWPGITKEELDKNTYNKVNDELNRNDCIPVYINKKDFENFYSGFSNKTIWPLFHYFSQYAIYDKDYWDAYKRVNETFAETILKNIKIGDRVWIHDYHLLLLPKFLKEKLPDVSIGFFLHIPFPSYELFRTIPWRMEILEGMLGADLIGFHTYDYERHFLSCVRRLKGYDISINQIKLPDRLIKADAFPMGIDFNKYHNAAVELQQKIAKEKSKIGQEIDKHFHTSPKHKLILAIDRLDYTKGISNRLLAYEMFLDLSPEYKEKVTLVLLSVPSRITVEEYQQLKSEVDEHVGRINGKFSTINWTPILYLYRSLPFESLIELYNSCEIALLTPLRDGMNLVAKEYIASRTDGKGVLILSEMTGAAKELSETILINPNSLEEIAAAIKTALEMPEELQKEIIILLQDRLKRYDIDKWASEFIISMANIKTLNKSFMTKKLDNTIQQEIINKYKSSDKRILFLDYDGTLVDFKNDPQSANPDQELYSILDQLAENNKNEIVLISGRDKDTFTRWFGDKKYTLIAEHGVWIKRSDNDWELIEQLNNTWKEMIRPGLEFYVDRTPGSFIEEKNYSLVWHYRKVDPELGQLKALELKDELTSLVSNYNLEILEGNKVIEVKNSGINKGRAAMHLVSENEYNFIIGIGDDWTDEYLFEELPETAYTIKVGYANTMARIKIENFTQVRLLLKNLAKEK